MGSAGAVGVTLEVRQDAGEAAPFPLGPLPVPRRPPSSWGLDLLTQPETTAWTHWPFPAAASRARSPPGGEDAEPAGGQAGVGVGGSSPPTGASPASRAGARVGAEAALSEPSFSEANVSRVLWIVSYEIVLTSKIEFSCQWQWGDSSDCSYFQPLVSDLESTTAAGWWDGGLGVPGEIWLLSSGDGLGKGSSLRFRV